MRKKNTLNVKSSETKKMILDTEQKAHIFDTIYKEYVTEHGLGGMSKSDLDALILWLIASSQREINSFELSNQFKIKESRIKSLLETAAVKFANIEYSEIWPTILEIFATVEFDIESLEKGQIRFQLKNPMLFRWIQERVRSLNSTCTYHRGSEQVTMNLDTLYSLLDIFWEKNEINNEWNGDKLETARSNIKKAIGRIGTKIEKSALEELREKKKPKLKATLEFGASLASIGGLVMPLLEKIN